MKKKKHYREIDVSLRVLRMVREIGSQCDCSFICGDVVAAFEADDSERKAVKS